jgi:CRISPR-associated protein Csm1
MRRIDEIALAGLLHDIGKFAQRTESYSLNDNLYKIADYRYAHAAYTAQVLNEKAFNLDKELADAAAMHHSPKDDLSWIIASADRMASGFERDEYTDYKENIDYGNFKQQRLWHLFDESRQFKIDTLNPENIMPQSEKPTINEYDELWKKFEDDLTKIKDFGTSSTDFFTIDYLLKKFTTFIPSSTTFKKGNLPVVKANVPLYDHAKATAIFSAALWALYEKDNHNIVNYYKNRSGDISQQDLLMICGDFFGIQKFIFDKVEAKYASKTLRAKSAYVQLLTKIIAFYIVEELGLSYLSIISTNAGKFEILGINTPETIEKLTQIQKKIDDFFVQNFFAETGLGVSWAPCALEDFIVKGRYRKELRPRIDKAVERSKFKKFDLCNTESVLEYDTSITNQTLCPLCHKRKIKDDDSYCVICSNFVKIGQKLARSTYLHITKNTSKSSIPIFGDFYIHFDNNAYVKDALAIFDIAKATNFNGYAKWEISSYVKKDSNNEVVDFSSLAESCISKSDDGKEDLGVKAIMSLKGDVDNMGNYIKNSPTTESFAKYNFFSRMVDYFFSVKATKMMEGKNLYTVFAGGDDIFILGAWNEVIEFAKELRKEFIEFAGTSKLTLSVGMVMTKPNKPINFVANSAENALENSKNIDDEKNAITLFNQTAKWDEYQNEILNKFQEILSFENKILDKNYKTSFWYRMIGFCNMRENLDKDIKNALWRSKVSYYFKRNIPKGRNDEEIASMIKLVDESIESHQGRFKMPIFEQIYKRRAAQ